MTSDKAALQAAKLQVAWGVAEEIIQKYRFA